MGQDYRSGFRVKAPGRVCLFGEHSDYLGLDVIAAAIDVTIKIEAQPREDDLIVVTYTDLKERDEFTIAGEIGYRTKRDYLRSAFNVMARNGFVLNHGWNLKVSGTIPIAAGLSSSSALTVGGIKAIMTMTDRNLPPEEIALRAYDAEVAEFGESGGTMDHFASSFGGVIYVNTLENRVNRLPAELNMFVVGDSGEKKRDTVGDLRYIRTTVEREYREIAKDLYSFDRRVTPVNMICEPFEFNQSKERRMAVATLHNRDLTHRALKLLSKPLPDGNELGKMLGEHHEILRDDLERSTPKIERLIEAAYDAGALGCKINGSGGGGSMMAYAVGYEQEVASAIKRAGGTPYIVKVSRGAEVITVN